MVNMAIIKLASNSLATVSDIRNTAATIKDHLNPNKKILIVVTTLFDRVNDLQYILDQLAPENTFAEELCPRETRTARISALQTAANVLAIACRLSGLPAAVFDQPAIVFDGRQKPQPRVNPSLEQMLRENSLVISTGHLDLPYQNSQSWVEYVAEEELPCIILAKELGAECRLWILEQAQADTVCSPFFIKSKKIAALTYEQARLWSQYCDSRLSLEAIFSAEHFNLPLFLDGNCAKTSDDLDSYTVIGQQKNNDGDFLLGVVEDMSIDNDSPRRSLITVIALQHSECEKLYDLVQNEISSLEVEAAELVITAYGLHLLVNRKDLELLVRQLAFRLNLMA